MNFTAKDIHQTQTKNATLFHATHGERVDLSEVSVTDGQILVVDQSTTPGEVDLFNVYNHANTGHYAVMLWPPGDMKHQTAIPKLRWTNDTPTKCIVQSRNEAAFRFKCDDARVYGVHFWGALDTNGNPIKQVVEARHGKHIEFNACTFHQSWPDAGQQKVKDQGYVTSQQIEVLIFDACVFTRWNGKQVIHRAPGVHKIIYAGCRNPDGKLFSRTDL